MVAGIVLSAVADERVIAHPGGRLGWTAALVALGEPAMFLAGHGLYKGALSGHVPVPRFAGAAMLVALVPLARCVPAVAAELVPVVVIAVIATLDAVRPD